MGRRKKMTALTILISALLLAVGHPGSVHSSQLVNQTPESGDYLFDTYKYQLPLAVFGPGTNAALPRVDAKKHRFLQVTMKETDQQVFPPPYGPTRLWVYEIADADSGEVLGPAYWPAVTIEAKKASAIKVKYVNELPSFMDPITINGLPATGQVQGLVTVDQTLHWADPYANTGMVNCMGVDCTDASNQDNPCCMPYTGSVPVVPHLHGGETPSQFDGGPEQWFTPDGLFGKDYASDEGKVPGEAVYKYDNGQEGGTLWFHDHALGATRTNVYSGMAGFYFIRDPSMEPKYLPSDGYEIEMAIQDRQFDTNGQLFWPDGSSDGLNGPPPNPDIHPFWNPEFAGDVVVVNGVPWPALQVEPRRYLFRILNGSNSRFYQLKFGDAPVYQIGSDDNYFDDPVRLNPNPPFSQFLLIAPGERAYLIVDFAGLDGQTVTVENSAPVPYPDGDLIPGADGQKGMASIMQFQVSLPLNGKDKSCDPAEGKCTRRKPVVRLTNGNGGLAPGVTLDKKRQLVLKEVMGPGGPVEVLVNNTKWDGLRSPGINPDEFPDGVTELPRVGSIEMWEIINLTGDAHPMHTHLTQFQILNREAFDEDYSDVWEQSFPADTAFDPSCTGGVFCPGYGPPLSYSTPNADGAVGGNPAIGPYLSGSARSPEPWESGWKDTAVVMPGEVMRIVLRWAPSKTKMSKYKPGKNQYSFDPTEGPGYVWHCHIIDHEDNEMMRPYKVTK